MSTLRLDRLARTAAADNWLHQPRRYRRRERSRAWLYAEALAGLMGIAITVILGLLGVGLGL